VIHILKQLVKIKNDNYALLTLKIIILGYFLVRIKVDYF